MLYGCCSHLAIEFWARGVCITLLSETPATKGDIDALRDELQTHYASIADLVELKSDLVE